MTRDIWHKKNRVLTDQAGLVGKNSYNIQKNKRSAIYIAPKHGQCNDFSGWAAFGIVMICKDSA